MMFMNNTNTNSNYHNSNLHLAVKFENYERSFKIGNMNVSFNPQFGEFGPRGTHQTTDGETVNSATWVSYGTLSVSYDDSVEISSEGQAALEESMNEKEKNYASIIGEMSKRLKNIFNALVEWSRDIILKTLADNDDAFGAKNIAETIKNSLSDFEDDVAKIDAESGEVNHQEKFKNAVAKYYHAFKNTVAEIYEEAKETAENPDGEFPEEMMGELLNLLKEAAESGEEIFVSIQDTWFTGAASGSKLFTRIEAANEQNVRDIYAAQKAVRDSYLQQIRDSFETFVAQ